MRNRQIKIGAVLAPQERQVLPASAVASVCRPCRRTAVTPPSTRHHWTINFRTLDPDVTSGRQISRARSTRIQAGIDSN
jgi:hypothetical protein